MSEVEEMAEKFDDNRVTVYLRPQIKDILEFVAKNDPVLSAGKRPNISGAITKIILEWEQSRRISSALPR